MKKIIALVIFLISATFVFANEIDNIKTIEDADRFLTERVKITKWKDESSPGPGKIELLPNKNKFFKLDLDNDGFTDLLISGKDIFAVIDKGDQTYQIHPFQNPDFGYNKYTLMDIIQVQKSSLLIVRHASAAKDSRPKNDSLIFKFNHFIEYNPSPGKLKIEQIRFSSYPGWSGPTINLTIDSGRSATYNSNRDKNSLKASIDTATFNNLIRLINYVDPLRLNDRYDSHAFDIDWTDLEVRYDKNQLKKIVDDGIGPRGLQALYDELYSLRKSQKWQN